MSEIKIAERRTQVQARLADGSVLEGPAGTPVEKFIKEAKLKVKGRVVAVLINGKLRELSEPLNNDSDLIPVTTADSDGTRIYRRSLTFLMVAAAAEVFPGRIITIHHSMPFGGYYCEREDELQLTDKELSLLKDRMRELVEENLPIYKIRVPLDEALHLFRAQGDIEKAELFARRRKDYLTLYELNGVRDYFHGHMVPSTCYLEVFDLRHYKDGFILQFPRRFWPGVLQDFEDEPRLAQVFGDYQEWLDIIGIAGVSQLNEKVAGGRASDIILIAEALHRRQISYIAAEIARRPDIKIVLISGPTSAGKTTFSKRLSIQLLASGIFPVTIGMDNYFVNREDTPRDEQGDYDYESLGALDLPLFHRDIGQLLNGETIVRPHYDFHTGRREWGDELTIGKDNIIVIEGIHGLNPLLAKKIPPARVYRIFISALTQINLDKHNRVPTTDTRMLRRIVRDAATRGYMAAETISRWHSVRRGEKRHIFPYQHNADIFFNSALVYELSVLSKLAQPLLLQVDPGSRERIEANRLIAFLQWFDPISPRDLSVIAGDSILREFIGGSVLEDFDPGQFERLPGS